MSLHDLILIVLMDLQFLFERALMHLLSLPADFSVQWKIFDG
jgi:hypothetical protein